MNVQTPHQPSRVNVVEPWVAELAHSIAAATGPILPHGSRSKGWLSDSSIAGATAVDLREHAGVVAYEPSEFLITARAGTSLTQLQSALADCGQYLPCDPMYTEAGGTIGGTVASGISGSSRLLYGTLRDFVMEVQFIDGLGKVVRGGGKVVKNAAGFDLPKLMVGSYGRLGIITELTLKVYPRPTGAVTQRFAVRDAQSARRAMQQLLAKPLPLAAVDLIPLDAQPLTWQLAVRFAAPLESLATVAQRAQQIVGGDQSLMLEPAPFDPLQTQPGEEADFWRGQAQFVESHQSGFLVRVAMGPNDLLKLESARQQQLPGCDVRYTGACSIAWLRGQTVEELTTLNSLLEELELSAVLVAASKQLCEGANEPLLDPRLATKPWLGSTTWCELARRIQTAIDPQQRFVAY